MRFSYIPVGALVLATATSGCSNTVNQTAAGGAGMPTGSTTDVSGSTTGSNTSTSTGTTSTAATGTSSTSTTSSQSSTSSGMTKNFGDCNTDADCTPNGHCIEVAPGGFRLCEFPVTEATMCSSAQDQCCTSATCMAGEKCYAGPLVPACSGVVMQQFNECAKDACATNADCPAGACMKAGTIGNKIATCIPAACTKDTDCTAQANGHCATVEEPCCHTTTSLQCIYAGNCRTTKDCGVGKYCAPAQMGAPTCEPGGPICPGG